MKDKNIVCFAKDWHEDPTSNNHVMRKVSERNNVLWLNSIATRSPGLTSGRDWGKIVKKLTKIFDSVEQVEDRLWIYTPIVLPYPFNAKVRWLNKLLIKFQIYRATRQIGFSSFQLWTFLPTAQPYFDCIDYTVGVYYCTDEWAQFSELDTDKTIAMENALCEKVDLVFATAISLLNSRKKYNDNCYLARHGVDYEHFSIANYKQENKPQELSGHNGPIVGFMGLIHDWVDQDLIVHIAHKQPNWSLVIIGNATVNIEKLKNVPNIYLLGRIAYEKLPNYIHHFNVAIIPFKINELTRHINPIKLREYISAGLPVVSTPLDEAKPYKEDCVLTSDKTGFVVACDNYINSDTRQKRIERSNRMKSETWDAVVESVENTVEKYL